MFLFIKIRLKNSVKAISFFSKLKKFTTTNTLKDYFTLLLDLLLVQYFLGVIFFP